jgi:hypothetical protein
MLAGRTGLAGCFRFIKQEMSDETQFLKSYFIERIGADRIDTSRKRSTGAQFLLGE